MTTFMEPQTQFPLSETDADRRAAVLALLSNPARLRLVTAVYLSPHSTVTQLSEDIELSRDRTSALLGPLRSARLVEHEMIGRAVHYRVSDEFVCSIISATLAAQ